MPLTFRGINFDIQVWEPLQRNVRFIGRSGHNFEDQKSPNLLQRMENVDGEA